MQLRAGHSWLTDTSSSFYQFYKYNDTNKELRFNNVFTLQSFWTTRDTHVIKLLSKDDCDLPSLYWIPKLHKSPYKQRYIAGSANCTTKPLSVLLTSILTTVKEGLQKYCDTSYSRSGVNDMWILKNS